MRATRRSRLNPLSGLGLVVLIVLAGAANCRKTTAFDNATPAPAPVQPDGGRAATDDDAEPLGQEFGGQTGEAPLGEEDFSGQTDPSADEVAAALGPVYFEYDSFALSDSALQTLGSNARWIQAHPQVRVLIEGHCDERGSIEYNLDLGAKRARTIRDQLARLGVAEHRLLTTSKGEEEPADRAGTEAAHARNRRAEFKQASP
jgi:peptidoglycan-associated lipoprotein